MCTMYVVHTIFIDYEQALRLKWRVRQAAVCMTLTPNIYSSTSWRACWCDPDCSNAG